MKSKHQSSWDMEDKENMNPNIFISHIAISSPAGSKAEIEQNGKSAELQSLFNTIHPARYENSQISEKTELRVFCCSVEELECNQDNQEFMRLAQAAFGANSANRKEIIEFCTKNNLFDAYDLRDTIEGKESPLKGSLPLKDVLCTDLGALIIEELCSTIQSGEELNQKDLKVLSILNLPNSNDEVTLDGIFEAYSHLKEEEHEKQALLKELHIKFNSLHKEKIEPKLWSDHFRLELSKSILSRESKQRLTFSALIRAMTNVLDSNDVSIVFKYVYGLENGTLMTILDNSKTISAPLLLANILGSKERPITCVNLQRRVNSLIVEQNEKKISLLENEKEKSAKIVLEKNKEIDRLKKMIDLLEIEKEELEISYEQKLEVQINSYKIKYEERIENLTRSNQEQVKLTQWYQRELEAIMKSVGKDHVMRKYLEY